MVINRYLAELLGTFILVGLGSMAILAAIAGGGGAAGYVAISFAFGLALLAAIWVVGHVSGAHFNPAVTLAMLLDRRINLSEAIGYWVGQFAGASVASLIVWAATGSRSDVAQTMTTYDSMNTAIVVEILLTMVFVWVVLAAVRRGTSYTPAAIALTLVVVHLAGIPFSGASVNPARSFGPAAVAADFGPVGVYLLAPLVGAVLAWLLYRMFPVEDD